jgi:TPR repeat protein
MQKSLYFNKTLKMPIRAKHHGNLDSLAFRFGYYFKQDTKLDLFDCSQIQDKYINDKHIKYGVRASFKLPHTDKTLQGVFILLRSDDNFVTVMRGSSQSSAFKAEHLLSETIRKLRENKYISADDNVEMYKNNVKTTVDVVRYLSEKIGSSKVQSAVSDAEEKINNLSEALLKSNKRADAAEEDNEYLTSVALISELEKEEAIEKAKAEKVKREKAEAVLEEFKAKYSENQSVAYISNEEQPEDSYDPGSEWNSGDFTLINAYSDIDNQGKSYEKIVVRIELESENGERFTVKNNWLRGHKERLKLAKQLIGQQVIYSTWQRHKYSSKIWFKNIKLANNQVSIDGEYFDLEEEITSFARDVVQNLKHEDHTINEGISYGDDPIGRANSAYIAKDYDLAIKLYLEINEPDSINAAADILFYQGNYKESIKYKHKSAELGFVGAFGGLAKAYREGWGVEIDYSKSSNWTLKGAEGGDVICMSLAGSSYALGLFGFKKNEEKACYWLGFAARYGDESANATLNSLGYRVECLENGSFQLYKIR